MFHMTCAIPLTRGTAIDGSIGIDSAPVTLDGAHPRGDASCEHGMALARGIDANRAGRRHDIRLAGIDPMPQFYGRFMWGLFRTPELFRKFARSPIRRPMASPSFRHGHLRTTSRSNPRHQNRRTPDSSKRAYDLLLRPLDRGRFVRFRLFLRLLTIRRFCRRTRCRRTCARVLARLELELLHYSPSAAAFRRVGSVITPQPPSELGLEAFDWKAPRQPLKFPRGLK